MTATTDALGEYYRIAQTQAATTAGSSAEFATEEAKPKKRKIGAAICEAAATHGADVIVVGAHGTNHAGEVLLGSVSQHVVHHARCPVLVIRPNDQTTRPRGSQETRAVPGRPGQASVTSRTMAPLGCTVHRPS